MSLCFVQSRLTQQWQKLVFLSTLVGICGLFVNLVPHLTNFYILLLSKPHNAQCFLTSDISLSCSPVIGVSGFFLGGLDTASNSLVLYMLGPQRSPPFTQVSPAITSAATNVTLSVSARHGGSRLHARLHSDPALPA